MSFQNTNKIDLASYANTKIDQDYLSFSKIDRGVYIEPTVVQATKTINQIK